MGWGLYLSHLHIRAKVGLVYGVGHIPESPGHQSKRGGRGEGGALSMRCGLYLSHLDRAKGGLVGGVGLPVNHRRICMFGLSLGRGLFIMFTKYILFINCKRPLQTVC